MLYIRIKTLAGVLFSIISAKSESPKRQSGDRCGSQFTIWIEQVDTNILNEGNNKEDLKNLGEKKKKQKPSKAVKTL